MARRIGKRKPPIDRSQIVTSDPDEAPRIASEIDVDTWIEDGVWANTISSNVSAIRYDADEERLYVTFNSSSGYYSTVDEWKARQMFGASSMGKFVHQMLKNVHGWHQL